jgi:hypothetical protein
MADQGKFLLALAVPSAATERALIVSSIGTLSTTLRPVGITYDSTDALVVLGQVQVAGTALVTLGATVAKGANVKSDSAGRGITATLGTDHNIIGQLLEGGDINELRRVLIAKS